MQRQITNGQNELYHHGILGMKWGVRRYQNADGSRTTEGKRRRRYSDDYVNAHTHKSYKEMDNKELRGVNERLNLEKNHRQLKWDNSLIGKGTKTAASLLAAYGTIKLVSKNSTEIAGFGKKALYQLKSLFKTKMPFDEIYL